MHPREKADKKAFEVLYKVVTKARHAAISMKCPEIFCGQQNEWKNNKRVKYLCLGIIDFLVSHNMFIAYLMAE